MGKILIKSNIEEPKIIEKEIHVNDYLTKSNLPASDYVPDKPRYHPSQAVQVRLWSAASV